MMGVKSERRGEAEDVGVWLLVAVMSGG